MNGVAKLVIIRRSSYSFLFYFILVSVIGMTVSYFFNNLTDYRFGSLIWLLSFTLVTLCFKSVREAIFPLYNLRPFYKVYPYLYILFGLLVPYSLMKLFIKYEVFLSNDFIFLYTNGLLNSNGMDLYYYIDILIFSPIWEEAFFRGVLLFILLKFLKPFWAITISSIVFSLFHPLYFVIIFVWGGLLAIMTYKTKSLIPAMITHSTWNLYAGKLILFF